MDVANLAVSGASLALSAAQTLFAALQCNDLREICSYLGYDEELENLQNTVEAVKAVLLDAEAKGMLNHQQLHYVQKLKDAVYKADDLFDEFATFAEQQQKQFLKGGKVSKKVRLLLSRFGELGVARKMSKNVKKIRKELDGIASDANKFSFKFDHEPIRRRREETCSYVHEKDVIGREKETEDIINMLLASHANSNEIQGNNLSILAIVGMGGLGKTTLAQVVFKHSRIAKEFQLRLWVCVADQDQKQLPLQQILEKILNSATGSMLQHGSDIELVQSKLRGVLHDKRYLLVLDDLWSEDHHQWLELKKFLLVGGSGSKVLVTTRSKETARAVGCLTPYELQGLSVENSWHLFEKIAFEKGGQKEDHELEDIGRYIVKMCANVPLSIRVVGSLLYGQGREKWVEYQRHGLSMLTNHGNQVIEILKFSYFQLSPPLKSCFGYCAIFPKDFEIQKETLISLWMAQGFGESLIGTRSTEDVYEEYFSILLRRCFFQDVFIDRIGDIIVSCKMHDLVHDMALEVSGNEILCMMDSTNRSLDKRIRHVSYDMDHVYSESCFNESRVRTFMGVYSNNDFSQEIPSPLKILMARWKYLRVIDFSYSSFQFLPEDIGSLIHLRYLDISKNRKLEKLPKSMVRLHHLQTLNMGWCYELKELPKDFWKLSKLSRLCVLATGLRSMPAGMGKLTCLRRLSKFIVSVRNRGSKQEASDVEDLRALKDLKGKLQVVILEGYKYEKQVMEGGYLSNKEHLSEIDIVFGGRVEGEEGLLEDLKPHRNIKKLTLWGYSGVIIPIFAKEENLYTSLESLYLWLLPNVKSIPGIGLEHLTSLQILELDGLTSLRLEDDDEEEGGMPWRCLNHCLRRLLLSNLPKMDKMPKGMQHLTSLQYLQIIDMKMEGGMPEWMGCLSSLQSLIIQRCKGIETMPKSMQHLTSLTFLTIGGCSETLYKRCQSPNGEDWPLIRHIPHLEIGH